MGTRLNLYLCNSCFIVVFILLFSSILMSSNNLFLILLKVLHRSNYKGHYWDSGGIWIPTILNNSNVSMLIFPIVIIVVVQENALVLRQIHAEVFRDEVAWCLQLTCTLFRRKEGERKRWTIANLGSLNDCNFSEGLWIFKIKKKSV